MSLLLFAGWYCNVWYHGIISWCSVDRDPRLLDWSTRKINSEGFLCRCISFLGAFKGAYLLDLSSRASGNLGFPFWGLRLKSKVHIGISFFVGWNGHDWMQDFWAICPTGWGYCILSRIPPLLMRSIKDAVKCSLVAICDASSFARGPTAQSAGHQIQCNVGIKILSHT